MNKMVDTQPGGETGLCGREKAGDLAANYSKSTRFLDSDSSLEIDRLNLKVEELETEIQSLHSIISGLLTEIDNGEQI